MSTENNTNNDNVKNIKDVLKEKKLSTPIIIALLLAGYVVFDVVNITDLVPVIDSLIAGAGSIAAIIATVSRAANNVKIRKKNEEASSDVNDVDDN